MIRYQEAVDAIRSAVRNLGQDDNAFAIAPGASLFKKDRKYVGVGA